VRQHLSHNDFSPPRRDLDTLLQQLLSKHFCEQFLGTPVKEFSKIFCRPFITLC
jgi:hypothetical protein